MHQHHAKRISTTEIHHNGPLSSTSTLLPNQSSSSLLSSIREPAEPSLQAAPAPPVTEAGPAVPQTTIERGDTLSLPNGPEDIGRRRSFDDRSTSPYTNGTSANLGVPTNKVDRRRSMQTGLQMGAPLPKEWRQNSGSPVPLGFSGTPHHESHESHDSPLSSLRTKGTEESRSQLSPSGDRPAVRPRANSLSPGLSPHTSRSTTPVPSDVQPSEQTSEENAHDHALRLPPKDRYGSVSPPLGVDTPQTPPVAPALPPITFSFSDTSFLDLISSVSDSKSGKKLKKAVPPILVPSEESSAISPISVESTNKFGSAPSSQNSHAPADFVSRTSSFDQRGSPIPEPYGGKLRERVDSNASASSGNNRPGLIRSETTTEIVNRRLRETLNEAKAKATLTVELDREFVEAILTVLQSGQTRANELKTHLDHMKVRGCVPFGL